MPRNDLKAYETLTARIPQELVDAVRHYASQHHCTVSDILRDSLQRYLHAESLEGRHGQTEVLREVLQEVLHGQTEVMQEVLQEARHGTTEVIQEVRRGHITLVSLLTALSSHGMTEVRQKVLHGETTEGPPVIADTGGGQTEVLQGQTEVIPHKAVPPFDPAKFRLGRLCVGEHAYHDTAQTLYRLPKMVCPACDAARARAKRAAKRQAAAY